jgi:protein O-mannosyl-transferase
LRNYKNHTYIIIIFLIIASCAAFGRIMGNDFINYDDYEYVAGNNHIQSGFNPESIKWAFTSSYFSYWHPLTRLSHMLDWSLFGSNPSGHHMVSLLLHIGAVLFLFLFFNKTTNNLWPSAFAAALFALHPLRVESVAWAAERKDVLSMFFGMACIYVYSFYAERSKLSLYFLSLLLFFFALMSKPMLVTMPFVLMLLDYWPLKRWQKKNDDLGNGFNSINRLIWEKVPFVLLIIPLSIMTLWAQNKIGTVAPVKCLSLSERVINATISYTAYLEKIFWPVNLAVFYPYEFSFPVWKLLISGLILTGITIFVLYYIRKLPFLFVGWFWYLGTLVPVIGLVQAGLQAMADRYTYLPSAGIAVGVAWGISSLINNDNISKKVLFPVAVSVLAIFAVLTWQQCGYWKNSIEIWNHALSVTKNNYLAHNNLASFFDERKIGEAMNHYNEAIRLKPDYVDAYYNRGNAYSRLGRNQQAIDDYGKAIRLKPDFADAYYNRGVVCTNTGLYQQAIADYSKIISLDPNSVKAYNNRGSIYLKLGQYRRAIEDYDETIRITPDNAYAYSNRAFVHINHGNKQLGCHDAQKACAFGICEMLAFARDKGYCP